MTKKEILIENIKNETLCKVGCSEIHGVGVFAIRDIPKGVELFKTCNKKAEADGVNDLTEEELESFDSNTVKLIKQYFAKSHLGTYCLPEEGINMLFWGYYINHSSMPNLSFKTEGEDREGYVKFVANKDIKEGEELTEDYTLLSQDKNFLQEQFKFLKRKAVIDSNWMG